MHVIVASANAKPGETALSVGTGYFEGNGAVGVGVASSSMNGERVFRMGSSITPGFSDIGLQASYQGRVGPAAARANERGYGDAFSEAH